MALNLGAIRYIDSSGIATLIEVLKDSQRQNKEFVLFGLSSAVEEVFRLTHVLRIFRIAAKRAGSRGNCVMRVATIGEITEKQVGYLGDLTLLLGRSLRALAVSPLKAQSPVAASHPPGDGYWGGRHPDHLTDHLFCRGHHRVAGGVRTAEAGVRCSWWLPWWPSPSRGS
ncbi:MAG: STAS domain-containing protein [Ignavibacteriota bacterium]